MTSPFSAATDRLIGACRLPLAAAAGVELSTGMKVGDTAEAVVHRAAGPRSVNPLR